MSVSGKKREPLHPGAFVRPRVVFLINGDRDSAMAQRADEFAKRLADRYSITQLFREGGRGHAAWRFFQNLRATHPHLVCVFDHALDGVLAARMHQVLTRIPWILDTGDDISALGKALGRKGLSMWMTNWLDRMGTRRASHIVVRGRGHLERMVQKGIAATWIPDGIDFAQFPNEARLSVNPPSTSNPLTIGVLGSSVWASTKKMCYGQDLIEIVHHLKHRHRLPFSVRGEMIGNGTGIPHLERQCSDLGLTDCITFLGRRNYSELPKLIRHWHVALSTQTNDEVGHVRTTGKLPIYLACNRFVIASRVGEAARLLPEIMLVDYHGGADPHYTGMVADHIATLVKNGVNFTDRADSRRIAENYFNYDDLAERYDSLIAGILEASILQK